MQLAGDRIRVKLAFGTEQLHGGDRCGEIGNGADVYFFDGSAVETDNDGECVAVQQGRLETLNAQDGGIAALPPPTRKAAQCKVMGDAVGALRS